MNPKVNLLDCSREPSDAQLEGLMRSVAAEARAKASVANTSLKLTLHKQAAEVRSRYNLSSPRPLASAA
mgnify:CR=1 FL=1